MNLSSDKNQAAYNVLEIQTIGEISYVPVGRLLDILEERAILCVKAIVMPDADIHTTNFARGRYAEMQSLQEALNELIS